jgi:carboxylesterase type B
LSAGGKSAIGDKAMAMRVEVGAIGAESLKRKDASGSYIFSVEKGLWDMAEKVSQAWIHFARNGNPNHKGIPNWPAYTRANGAAMILDNTCAVRNHHDRELMSLLAPEIKF